MKRDMMRNGSDEDYDVNSVMDSGSAEWHVIADTELEEFTASYAISTAQSSCFSKQQSNSRLIQGDLSVNTQIRRKKNRKRIDWLLVT